MSKLFSITDIPASNPVGTKEGASIPTGTADLLAMAETKESMISMVDHLQPDQAAMYYTRGAWSMHELLAALIMRKTGPAAVSIATWTITEDPARQIAALKHDCLISHLSVVIDYRIKHKHPKPFQLLQGVSDRLCFAKSHAKVTIIQNEDWSISIIGSANYSRNPRLEMGYISARPADAVFLSYMLNQEFDRDNGRANPQ